MDKTALCQADHLDCSSSGFFPSGARGYPGLHIAYDRFDAARTQFLECTSYYDNLGTSGNWEHLVRPLCCFEHDSTNI